jgi:hypothetical protein
MAVRLLALRAGRSLHTEISSGTHFCWRLSKPQGLVRPEGLGKLKEFNDLNWTQTLVLPVCSITPLCYLLPHNDYDDYDDDDYYYYYYYEVRYKKSHVKAVYKTATMLNVTIPDCLIDSWTLRMEPLRSSVTSINRATQRHVREVKSYHVLWFQASKLTKLFDLYPEEGRSVSTKLFSNTCGKRGDTIFALISNSHWCYEVWGYHGQANVACLRASEIRLKVSDISKVILKMRKEPYGDRSCVFTETGPVCSRRHVLCFHGNRYCVSTKTSPVCPRRQALCAHGDRPCVFSETGPVCSRRQVMCVLGDRSCVFTETRFVCWTRFWFLPHLRNIIQKCLTTI